MLATQPICALTGTAQAALASVQPVTQHQKTNRTADVRTKTQQYNTIQHNTILLHCLWGEIYLECSLSGHKIIVLINYSSLNKL